VNIVNFWIRNFPALQREAITEALESARLGKIRRALRLIADLPEEQRGPLFTIELLSTYNLEPVLPTLELACNCLPSRAQVQLGPLNDIEGHITTGNFSGTAASAKARVILWRAEELMPQVLFPLTSGFPGSLTTELDQAAERVERIINLNEQHAPGVPLFISTVPLPIHFANPLFAAQHSAGAYAAVGRFNQIVYEVASARSGVYVLDACAWAAAEGRRQADPLLDFMAREPLSAEGQVSFALFLARCLRSLVTPRSKVLAIDLDDTLWGGIVGEDGVSGLELGHEFPGNVHLRIQRELLELRNRGILLVLLSKNNEADARLAFDSLPEMLLKWEDFTIRKINWNHKHDNLRLVSHELGLGLDSFVFIDDSDYEREQMRQLLPEVRILNESGDPLEILRALWETDAFDSLTLTDEDRLRHHDYAVRHARDAKAHGGDLQGFLQSLKMEATIEKVGPANIERIVSMLGKTNQFNLTTRRHSRAEVEALLQTEGSIALALRLRDRFGEQGIVAVLLAVPINGVLAIDSYLVSCRALGRGVEDALWSALLLRACGQKVRSLEASYIPTAKNEIVSRLYDRLGLERVDGDLPSVHYKLEPVRPAAWPCWIVDRSGANE
jgi:FkbH-like protein